MSYRIANGLLAAATLCFLPVAASLALRDGGELLPPVAAAVLLGVHGALLGAALGLALGWGLLPRWLLASAASALAAVHPVLWRRAIPDPAYPAWIPSALLLLALAVFLTAPRPPTCHP